MQRNNRKIGIITQARTTSTRLPKKVLMEVNGESVLECHLKRLKESGYDCFVATTVNQTDDEIVKLCERLKVPFYRGSENDVLARFYECAKNFNLDVVVRVTSDCPLIDGKLVARGVQKYLEQENENSYVSNCIVRTFPRGFDYEVFSFKALDQAYLNANEQGEREHVTPFVRNREKNLGVNIIDITREVNAGSFRLTLDEVDDWKLLKLLIEDYKASQLSADEIINLLNNNKQLAMINAHVEQKKV